MNSYWLVICVFVIGFGWGAAAMLIFFWKKAEVKSDMVAVSGDFDYGDKVWIACYCDDLDGKTYWSDMDANTLYNVIAWMPLPEPYRGEEK